jgi:hypothetical protein
MSAMRNKAFSWLCVSLAMAAAAAAAAEAPPSAAGVAFYEKSIRPLLAEHCYECHSAKAKRLRGGLRLDSEQGWLRGGDLGGAVKPGDPEESLLIAAVRQDDELKMPPKGKLSQEQIALLTRWVAIGAPAPRGAAASPAAAAEQGSAGAGVDIERGREFWAFRPPADPRVPEVTDPEWARTGLDRFILAVLEAKGLAPAPVADRRTLIRRATFDLTGVPPTAAEIEAFLTDASPDAVAFARVVERLLASPHYGERWGRHWLDLARYADSNGLDENVAHGNAWRYRDYVIAAFNGDKPYNQFVLEQLAGDLLPDAPAPGVPLAVRHERLIATGFLCLGPKVLAEPDERKMEMDIVDEQVDTVGRTFLGLTLGCARCHDHKFDPIPSSDYYGLAGVFKSTRTMETFKKVAKWHENSLADEDDLARKATHDQKVAAQKKAIDERIAEANQDLRADGGDGFELPKMPEKLYPEATRADLKRLRGELTALEKAAPEMPSAMGMSEGQIADTALLTRGNYLTPGVVVPRHVPRVLDTTGEPRFGNAQSGRLELARWLIGEDHPLTSRVMVNRLWRWHFGQGLVATPDNFGALGDRPSHPPLLDWLAHRFIDSGWSIKAMHRLIMQSSTYQMASDDNSRAAQIDPENRLCWRMNVLRLEAEAIRDALLAVAGTIDRRMEGSLLTIKNRDYFFNHTSRDGTTYDSLRRSIYLPVVRNHLYEVFQLHDYADPSVTTGDRATTTVAPQALFMLNGELVIQAAHDLAARLLASGDLDDSGRIVRLYEDAYGRPPDPAESRRATVYLGRFAQRLLAEDHAADAGSVRLGAWQALCQVILASNEFVFIR